MDEIQRFLLVFDAYCSAVGKAQATVSAKFLGRGSRIEELRAGGDIGAKVLARTLRGFSVHWPEGAEWPEGIERPSSTEEPE